MRAPAPEFDDAIKLLTDCMLAGHAVLSDRIDACAVDTPDDQPDLSLLELSGGRVCFVRHLHCRRGWGQLIRLSETHLTVMRPTYKHDKPNCVGDAFVVHPSTGVELSGERSVPAEMFRLHAMWTTGLTGGVSLTQPACHCICKDSRSRVDADSVLLRCPMCLTMSHPACLSDLMMRVGSRDSFFAPVLLPISELSRWQPRTRDGFDPI